MAEDRKTGRKSRRGGAHPDTPALEWIAAAIGLVLTLAILGAMAWEAWVGSGDRLPAIEARIERIVPAGTGYVAEIVLDNRSPSTAAAVEVEGELTKSDGTTATSTATIDYVPGASVRRAGLVFTDDPRRGRLEIRVLGYSEP
ncbi:hypothetical protein [Sphingosinicella humi]|uniref:TIGR02588 family protein n=1 Tax=Allosphingosinicella humi TaxID=2068657 RepID=A0A2U2J143_9SPHN|nr:hypothetical protein [Sphingosinicella humi]PWG02048.1 hypothetical protein DF286_03560 [Sphingosinicella humi]